MTCWQADDASRLLLIELNSLSGYGLRDALRDATNLTILDLLQLDSGSAPHIPENNLDRIRSIIDIILRNFQPIRSRYSGTDRQLILSAAQASELLSLQLLDKTLAKAAQQMYLLFLELSKGCSGEETAYWHVLLRFLKRGWITSATALYQQGSGHHKALDIEERVSLEIRAKNITALLYFYTHQYKAGEQAISAGLDLICDVNSRHISNDRTGLLFLFLVNHCRLLARVGRAQLAIHRLTALQSYLRKRGPLESLCKAFGRHLPSWFVRSAQEAEPDVLRGPDRMLSKEVLWVLLDGHQVCDILALQHERAQLEPATDADFAVGGFLLWAQSDRAGAWGLWIDAISRVEDAHMFAVLCYLTGIHFVGIGEPAKAKWAIALVYRYLVGQIRSGYAVSTRDLRLVKLLRQLPLSLGLGSEYRDLVSSIRSWAEQTANEVVLDRFSAF